MNLYKNTRTFILYIVAACTMMTSCDDTTDTLGMSLTDNDDVVEILSNEFNVSSNSVAASKIESRTSTGYLGKVKDTETDNYITCNYMTQFRVMEEPLHGKNNVLFPSIDTIYIDKEKYDETVEKRKQIEADSCALILYITKTFGDSLALMKVSANEMSVPYEESETYMTDFNPEEHGMIRTGAGSIHSQMAYTTSNRVYTEKQRNATGYTKRISISLNDPYTDKDGNVYNNYGTYLMRNFYDPAHRDSYFNSYKFSHDICPGFYIKHEGGVGNVASISNAQIIVFYRAKVKEDSTIVFTASFAGTEEVIQKTNIQQNGATFETLLNDESCSYIKSPASIFTELTIPVDKVIENHELDTINTARVFIPRINDSETNDYSLSIPKTLLLLQTDSVESFFSKKKVADFRNSFIATYSSTTNGYTFSNISLLVSIMNNIKKQAIAEGKELSPNWNKVTIIPVETTYTTVSSTTQTLTKVTHDMSFASTKLKKGTDDSPNIKLSVIYSKFK